MKETDIISYKSDSGVEVRLSPQMIRQLQSGAGVLTGAEIGYCLKLCEATGVNPWIGDVHFIKYGSEKVSIVTGKGVFTKRAAADHNYDGPDAGIIVERAGEIIELDGCFMLPTDTLLGGWAKAYRKDWAHPVTIKVYLTEYIGLKRDGTPNRQWSTMPGTMIRKVALVQALREAFPERLNGLYDPAEVNIDIEDAKPVEAEVKTVEPEKKDLPLESQLIESLVKEISMYFTAQDTVFTADERDQYKALINNYAIDKKPVEAFEKLLDDISMEDEKRRAAPVEPEPAEQQELY